MWLTTLKLFLVICSISLTYTKSIWYRQGFSKVEDPGKSLVRMRGETPTLASDVGNLMQIHQGEHHGVEHGQHLSHQREAHATTIFSQGRIASPVEPIFHGPMLPNQLGKTLRATALWRESRPARDHLDTALLFASAFALHTKDLSDLTPVTVQIVIEIRTAGNLAPF
jgi:hypothetical protein